MRKLVALAIAPLVTLLPIVAFPSQWGFFAFLTLFYAYPLAVLVGLPCYFYCRYKGWLKLWQVMAGGALIGVALPSLLTLSFLGPSGGSRESNNGLGSLLTLPLMGAVCGAAVSLVISGSSR
jgi:RsiW-degrading membrane proteinase PrsW (M82 family)